MVIAGSGVWAVSEVVYNFTVVISHPLPPILYQFLDNPCTWGHENFSYL